MVNALPGPKVVKDLFEELLDREVAVGPADPPRSGDITRLFIAVYVDASLQMKAIAAMDVGLAAYTGAALGLVPAGGVRDLMATSSLSPVLVSNIETIYERLIATMGAPSLRLYQTFTPGQPLPADVSGHLLALGKRRDLSLALQGYGKGRLSIICP
ncbi:MAG: hypothetical protein JWO79_1667 [Actinomycetia bacterium]|jgi:hypothetical protein|nr:hypothetical protein [Actinomycetes bacterium]